jgi:hypothetical protein
VKYVLDVERCVVVCFEKVDAVDFRKILIVVRVFCRRWKWTIEEGQKMKEGRVLLKAPKWCEWKTRARPRRSCVIPKNLSYLIVIKTWFVNGSEF